MPFGMHFSKSEPVKHFASLLLSSSQYLHAHGGDRFLFAKDS